MVNMDKIYKELTAVGSITLERLYELGYTEKEINYLFIHDHIFMNNNKLIINIEEYYTYIINNYSFVSDEETNLMINGLRIILSIDPYYKKALYLMFNQATNDQNMNEALEYLNRLYCLYNSHSQNDEDFYLYLISMIIEIPNKYPFLKDRVYHLYLENILYPYKDIDKIEGANEINYIRRQAYREHFSYAFKLYNDYSQKCEYITARDFASKTLLLQAIEVTKKEVDSITFSIDNSDFYGAYKILKSVEKKHFLKKSQKSMKNLIKTLFYIILTGNIPEIGKNTLYTNTYDALYNNDYIAAYKLNREYILENCTTPNNNKEILLKHICDIIDKIKNNTLDYESIEFRNLLKQAVKYYLDRCKIEVDYDTIDVSHITSRDDITDYLNTLKANNKSLKKSK